MKFILAFLILIGGLAGIFAVAVILVGAGYKIEDWERELSWKYKKYRKFKEKVLPWIAASIIALVLMICLDIVYFRILEIIN